MSTLKFSITLYPCVNARQAALRCDKCQRTKNFETLEGKCVPRP